VALANGKEVISYALGKREGGVTDDGRCSSPLLHRVIFSVEGGYGEWKAAIPESAGSWVLGV
jgi:hypothetical protein